MELTVEQVKEVAEKQPEFKSGLLSSFKDDFIKTPPADVVVRTKDEDQKFLDSHVNTVVEERVKKEWKPKLDEEFGKTMSAIDQEIKSITGIDKIAGEKTTAYAKRAIEEKKAQGGDPVGKERIKQLEQTLETLKTDYETKLKESDGKLFSREIEWQLNSELDKVNIALPIHLKTDQEKQGYITQQKSLIKQGFLSSFTPKKDEQGNLVFYKGEVPQLSTKDGKAKTAGELISEQFASSFVPVGQTQTGTGTGSSNGQGSQIPAGGFKDKESIHKHLAALGLDAGSREYLDQLRKLAVESKIEV